MQLMIFDPILFVLHLRVSFLNQRLMPPESITPGIQRQELYGSQMSTCRGVTWLEGKFARRCRLPVPSEKGIISIICLCREGDQAHHIEVVIRLQLDGCGVDQAHAGEEAPLIGQRLPAVLDLQGEMFRQ